MPLFLYQNAFLGLNQRLTEALAEKDTQALIDDSTEYARVVPHLTGERMCGPERALHHRIVSGSSSNLYNINLLEK